MTVLTQAFTLPLGYEVVFTRDLFAPGNPAFARPFEQRPGPRLLAVFDAGLLAARPDLPAALRAWCDVHPAAPRLVDIHVLAGGEACKNDPAVVDTLAALFMRHGLCRHSYVLAAGGGAILDVVGYAASITHRGLRLLRAPATVLAQNDSGVGVKNGVNRFGMKNFYGVFAPPAAVFCDLNWLDALPDRVWHSGVSEAFKVGCLKDREFLEFLIGAAPALHRREPAAAERMITGSAALHLRHIGTGGDPFEQGNSRPLDFGHWSAHKLETLTNFALLHGEAVAIGVALDLHYAALSGLITLADAQRVCAAMRTVGLPIYHPFLHTRAAEVRHGLVEFREHLGGHLCIAMPNPLGARLDLTAVDDARLVRATDLLADFAGASAAATVLAAAAAIAV